MTDADEMAIQLPKATIRALDLKGGEVLVLRFGDFISVYPADLEQWLTGVNAALKEQGKAKVRVLALVGGETIEMLDEVQMRAAGWVRAGSTPV